MNVGQQRAVWVLPLLLIGALSLAPGAARADVSNVSVSLSNQVVSEKAVYTVSLTLGTDLPNGGTFVVTFPSGTVLSTSMNTGDVHVIEESSGYDRTAKVSPAVSGQQMTITRRNGGSFTAGNLIQLMIGQVDDPSDEPQNPSTQGNNYTLTVHTSAETNDVTSGAYTITLATMSAATVTPALDTTGAHPTYQFDFITSKTVPATGWFHLIFNDSTTINNNIDNNRNFWRINGDPPSNVTLSGQDVRLKVPNNTQYLPGEINISLVDNDDTSQRLTNPSTPSSGYTMRIFTSDDKAGTSILDDTTASNPYIIRSSTAPTVTGVTVSPTTVSGIASYTIASALPSGHKLGSGDTLTYTFPSGTVIPSSISTSNVTLTHSGSSITVSSIVTNTTDRTVALVLSDSLQDAGPDTVTFSTSAGIANPSTSGSSYTVTLRSTLETTAGTSNTYSITASTTLTPANVTISPNTFKTASQYTMDFSVGSSGALTANSGTITIVFPNDTELPGSIATSKVTVNSVTAYAVSVTPGTRTLTITTGTNIANNASVSVVVDASAGIKNPTSTGSYTLSLGTSAESAQTSNPYTVVQSVIAAPTVTLGSSQPLIENQYTVAFTVGSGGDLVAGSSTITLDFDDSTTVSSSIAASDITVNGTLVSLAPTISTSQSKITLTSPVNVSGNGSVSVVISAGISNPTVGSYTMQAYTSVETTQVTSESYSVTTATSITDLTVTQSEGGVSAKSPYTFSFTATNMLRGADDHYIYVNFPTEFDLSGLTDKSALTLTDDGASVKIRRIDTDLPAVDIAVKIGNTETIYAGSAITLKLGDSTVTPTNTQMLINPSLAAGSYVIKVHTTTDANPVSTPYVTVTTATALSSVSVTPSPTTANTIAAYTISATTASNAKMTAAIDTFYVEFPATATLPSTIATSDVQVNGSDATAVSVSGQTVKIVTPVTINQSTAVTLSIASSAGIRNPTATGSQSWNLSTNVQPTTAAASATISAISSVSSANVTPTPTTVNTAAQYTLDFTMGGTALSSGDTITVTFPNDTNVPTTMATSDVTVKEGGTAQTLTSVSTDIANRKAIIIVGEAVASGAAMQIVFGTGAGIKNPTSAGNSYTLTVAATGNGSAASNVYSISNSQVATATVTPSPSTQSTAAQYTVAFTVGAGGALTAGTNTITITFPTGTTVPSFIAASDVTVNGTLVASAPSISSRVVTLTTPVNVSNSGSVSVVFSSNAGITNPSVVSTGYTVKVYTSREPTEVTSLAYSITRGTDLSGVSVSLGTANKSQASTYTISFTTGSGGVAVGDTFHVVFPSGTTVPSSISTSNVTLGGANPTEVVTFPSERRVRVRSNATIGATTASTLSFTSTDMTNPSSTGSNYTLTIRKDSTASPVTSSKYTVTAASGDNLTSVTVTPSPATTASSATYTITATTSADGALVVGDSIIVVFPSGTTVPSSMAASAVSVDGVTATTAPVIDQANRRVAVVTPTAVSASSSFSLAFGTSAGLVNPTTAGSSYQVTISTNIQTATATSSAYTIAASATVSTANVTPSPSTAGVISQYTITFSLGGTTALVAGDTISVTFPSGTTVPSSIDTSAVDVKDDGTLISEHSTNGVTTDPSNRIVRIRVGAGIAVSSSIEITFKTTANIQNPTTAANNYTVTVAATNNGSKQSNVYEITASTVSSVSVSVSPSTENLAAAYTVSLNTGAAGALSAGTGTVSIVFPSGTTIPTTMAANKVTLNGTALASAPTCNTTTRTITVTTPVAVSASSTITIVFDATAGLENPSAGTNYTVEASTSSEGTSVQSSIYTITSSTSISNVEVSLGNTAVDSLSAYTVTFTTGTGGMAVGDTMHFVFPTGTTIPSSISASTVTVNGSASSSVLTFPSERRIRVVSNTSVSASSTATVVFTKVASETITNPSTSGSNYTLTARIDSTASQTTSANYTITAPPTETLATATVTTTPATASATASYTVATTTGAHGALVPNDTITVVFPSGTTVPSSIVASHISVNGTVCSTPPTIDTSSRTVEVINPTSVSASSALSIVFGTGAGIVNPSTATSYTLDSLYTNIQPIGNGTASSSYTISAATQVSAATVTPSPATVSATAQYTLSFTIGSTADLTLNTDTITVIFPSGTTVPSSMSLSSVTMNGVNAAAVAISGDTVRALVGSTISAGSSVTMVFKAAAGLVNPSTTGNYTLKVRTSQETALVSSNVYTISASTVSAVSVTLDNQLTSQQAQYTVSFTTGSGGALTSGSGTISITFPSGTGIGTAIARSSAAPPQITVNGSNATTVTVSTLTVTITAPADISASTAVTVVFASGANMLTNPATANNNYQVSVKTSAETTPVSSSTYAVTTNTTVSNVTASLSATGAGQTSTYTIGFRLGAAGAITQAGNDSITITFPTGTSIATLATGDVTIANNTNPGANPSATPTISGLVLYLRLPSGASYANSDSVTVIISNSKITNPSATGTNKTIAVNTTKEPDPISSTSYTIVSTTTALTGPTVTVNPDTVNAAAAYTITFSTGSKGALLVGDAMTVTFPSGTTVPGSMNATDVRVNGTALTSAPTTNASNRTVQLATPVALDTSASVEIAFLAAAGLVNPSTTGFRTLTVVSVIETTTVSSASYGITSGTQTGKLTVAIGTSTPSNQNITAGQDSVLVLQMKLTASAAETLQVTAFEVKANGTGADNTRISAVKVWDDVNSNGSLDGDQLLASTTFSADDTIATFSLSNVEVPKGTSRDWLVSYTISSSAISGKTFYPTVVNNTYLTVTGKASTSPISGDSLIVTSAPITGATLTVSTAQINIDSTDISPSGAPPGTENVGMLKLSMTAAQSNAQLQSIKVNNRRTSASTFYEADIDSAKIYLDNGNGTFSPSEETYLGGSTVTGANGGSATITLSSVQTIGTTAKVYFIAFDFASGANPAHVTAAQLADSTYLGFADPIVYVNTAFPIETAGEASLPVEMQSFTATALPTAVKIDWTTESEVENQAWRLLRVELSSAADTAALAHDDPDEARARIARTEKLTALAVIPGQGNKPSRTDYTFLDRTAEAGFTYAYYLVDIDFYGRETFHGPLFATAGRPAEFRLAQNYPNPFNPTTLIQFDLPFASRVELTIYNTLGQRIATLENRTLPAGYHRVVWDGSDDAGRSVASGTYLYRIVAASKDGNNTFTNVKRMTVVK